MVVGTSGKENTITVDGELDASKGTLTEATGSTVDLYSEGKTRILTNNNIDINSAYYNDGEKVYTCIVDAVAYAEKNGLTQVRLMGKFVDTSDVTTNGVSIILDSGADVKLGNVTLKNAEIKHNDNTSKLTATVSGLFGTGSDAVTSEIDLSESNTAVKASTTLNSSGVEVYRLAIDGVSGKNVEISEGTIAFTSDSPAIAGKFIIAEGATVIIDKEVLIDGKDVEFIAFGDIIVKDGGVLDLKNTSVAGSAGDLDKTPILNGTLTLIDGSTVNLYALDVIGSIIVTEQTTKSNVLNIKDSKVFVGVPIQSVAGAGSISGPVKLTDSKFIVAYAGADLSAAKINYVSGETDVVSTTYSINGIEYATVFAKEGTIDLGGSNAPITIDMIKKIKGLSVSGTATTSDIVWKDAAGKNANDKKVGDLANVDTTISLASSTIKISVGTGISLYVDDVKVIDSTLPLTVGTHTVKAIVDPMYKGDVTITFDGKTVTDGKIIVSVDSNGVVLSATGNITIDSGDTPAPTPIQPTEKDDSLGITEYLLIVLVVLAAILVVVVAIRMMRS